MKQQQNPSRESKTKTKTIDLETVAFVIRYESVIYTNDTQLNASIYITPKKDLSNTPVQIELRGYSHIQTFNLQEEKTSEKSLQVTEDFLNETDQKLEINVLMGESKKFDSIQSDPKARAIDDMNEEQKKQGEYFLEGCNVLYQKDENTGERLQTLVRNVKYQYPVHFSLPNKLPNSIDNIVLKDIHIIIKYTLEIKLILVEKSFAKRQCQTITVPFQIELPEKHYPYEQLVLRDLIRCYHAEGKRKDEVMSRPLAKFINCLCPRYVYDKFLDHQHHFRSTFETYDLYHLQLVAVVNKGLHIFLVVRAYQEPEADSLTFNRDKSEKGEKKENKVMIKQVNSLGEVPNDISLVSMKQTQRKHIGLGIFKVEVEMVGELVNICTYSIFKKVVTLNQSNYDMVEGEAMINLSEYTLFAKSCNNELFTLKYHFNVKAIFEEDEGQGHHIRPYQDFVVESNKKELPL